MLYWATAALLCAAGACLAFHIVMFVGRALLVALRGQTGTSVVYVNRPRAQLPVQKIATPATVYDIRDHGNRTVSIHLATHASNCQFTAYWGVSIKDFPWNDGIPHQVADRPRLLAEVGRHQLVLDVKECDLGDQLRVRYQLVGVTRPPVHCAQTMASLYSIFHVSGCSLKAAIVQQYLKIPSIGTYESDSSNVGSSRMLAVRTLFDEHRCVICMDQPVTHTLLPCRHACVCHECFDRVGDHCPICRRFVYSFFVTVDPKYSEKASLLADTHSRDHVAQVENNMTDNQMRNGKRVRASTPLINSSNFHCMAASLDARRARPSVFPLNMPINCANVASTFDQQRLSAAGPRINSEESEKFLPGTRGLCGSADGVAVLRAAVASNYR